MSDSVTFYYYLPTSERDKPAGDVTSPAGSGNKTTGQGDKHTGDGDKPTGDKRSLQVRAEPLVLGGNLMVAVRIDANRQVGEAASQNPPPRSTT